MSVSSLRRPTFALAVVLAAACGSDSSTEPPPAPVTETITLDAATAYGYVKLGTPAQIVTVGDPAASAAWDLGFFATTATANGGPVGPGGVSVHCICQNATLSDAALRDLTAASQLPAFEAVGTGAIPGDDAFKTDELTPAISGWFNGAGASATANPGRAWLLRKGTTTSTVGKFRVTALQNASAANAGQITFEYALQPAAGGEFGASQTRTVDVRSGAVHFDLTAGAATTAAGSWDLRFSAFDIRANGGVSGSGSVSALVDNSTPYAAITAGYAGSAPATVFRRDAYSGVLNAQPWYKYNITGTDNQIWPTFNVYLVKRGNEVYKVQVTSYYSTTGASRQITLRYARLR